MKHGQIINFSVLNGPFQMASDVMMLENLNRTSDLEISIRFYRWEGNWLSIGHHQKDFPKHWATLVKNRKLNLVRRPSGGGAVLHSGGLTYSLAWKSPPRKRNQAYIKASQWLINSFAELGLNLKFGNTIALPTGNCFSTSSNADLVDKKGLKRIGSAQFWRGGNVLQHGEILLDPPLDLWHDVFNSEPPKAAPQNIPRMDLEKILAKSLCKHWPSINWIQKDFQLNELEEISKNSKAYLVTL
ncbi:MULTISPECIES: lipoate--protein ligase family protein [unclassified Prochlorococcus]|uniref:lipoate--protein ligase family protein n=1 Tax=unclassified Prochlorococcus TaxID=2627481 RepID=UPI000533748E|nr:MULTISPECIES: lipoate--protein ligase family protein [unclassified Prochlorococcus]KGG16420.1 Lipoate-protein ligase A [Prochlorococcus sp. MIT 0602]KGG17106.1 Lipoate-protein ligase A [Prochlorococcus sp. MIT 0603]